MLIKKLSCMRVFKFKNSLYYLLLCLSLICIFSACVNSHESEINRAKDYLASANSRLTFSSFDWTTIWVGSIKANASAARNDINEAQNILNNIPINDLSEQDQTDLKAFIIMVNVYGEMADLFKGPFADLIDNAQTYNQTKDPQIASRSVSAFKVDLQNMKTSLFQMNDELSNINENVLSPKFRSEFIVFKTTIQSYQDSIDKVSSEFENACTTKCYSGYVLGTDCQCHPECGSGYCTGDSECCNGECYKPCSSGYILGTDCQCHPSCGGGYCTSDSQCCNGQCRSCLFGYILGTDCQCHPSCGSGYCTGNSQCCNGRCLYCSSGNILGTDCQCHPPCGSGYCTADSQCCNGRCLYCNPGYYLGSDCYCYPY